MRSNTITAKKNGSNYRKGLTAVLLATGVFLVFVWNWHRIVNHSPAITIPAPVMPATNAYDTYLKANRAMRAVQALDTIVFNGIRTRAWKQLPFSVRKSLDDQNSEALALIRTGLQQSYRQPPVRSFRDTFPSMKFRQLARLLALDVNVRAESGDWNGALSSRLDQIEFSEHLYRGGGMMGLYTGAACQKCQLPSRGDMIAHLDLPQSRSAIKRLEGIMSRRCPFSEMLIEEKWAGVRSMDTMFRDENWRDGVASSQTTNPAGSHLDEIQRKANLLMVDKRLVMRSYTHYMDQCAEAARTPLYRGVPFPEAPADPINQLFNGDLKGAQKMYAEEESANKLFLLKIALHAYHLQHGRYPANLTELSPEFLLELPDNPLGANGLFSYQFFGNSYLIFNAGSPPSNGTKPAAGSSGPAIGYW